MIFEILKTGAMTQLAEALSYSDTFTKAFVESYRFDVLCERVRALEKKLDVDPPKGFRTSLTEDSE